MAIPENLLAGPAFEYFILPFLIFIARIIDVTFGTVRIVMVAKGQKLWAPVLGFFEVLIWLIAIAYVFENLDNWPAYFGYAAGFATGNYIGLKIEEKLAMGIVKIQIITRKSADTLIENLKEAGFRITHHNAYGGKEDVSIIYTIIKRNELPKVVEKIKVYNPNAFYSIEDVRFVSHGLLPLKTETRRWRKGK